MADKTVTIRPSGGDYTTIAAAVTGEVAANANLTATGMNGILTFSIEGTWSADDTTAADINGFTTDSTHYVKIVDNSSGTYHLRPSAAVALYLHDNYHRVIGLRVSTTLASGYAIRAGDTGHVIDRCKVVDSQRGIYATGASAIIVNCIVDKVATRCIYGSVNNGYIYNCTVGNSSGTGIELSTFTGWILKNCYSGGNSGADYSGTGSPTLTTCYSEDGTLSTSTAAFTTSTFTDVTSGAANFALVTGSGLIDTGTDLSSDSTYPFNWDFANNTRSGTWEVGAYNYAASGISIPVVMAHRRKQGMA